MKLDIPDEDLPLFIRALEHYSAYLTATDRSDSRYTEWSERLKRKEPESEKAVLAKKKRA